MSGAEMVAEALDSQRSVRGWRAPCPVHHGAALSMVLSDAADGRLRVHCFAGCRQEDILAELRRIGVWKGKTTEPLSNEEQAALRERQDREDRRRVADALDNWSQTAPATETLVERYLVFRAINMAIPSTVRFAPRFWHSPGVYRPAMVCLVEHVNHGPLGIHVTYLAMGGKGKTTLKPQRKFFGRVTGAPVRLAPFQAAGWLAIAEGVEAVMSILRTTGRPTWAALSVGGIKNLVLPPEATQIVISADNDANGVGQRAAGVAANRLIGEGRRVGIVIPAPPRAGAKKSDFNDILCGKTVAMLEKPHYAAR